ncbi:MAG TPA: DUF1559 domain-containing protein, partial [Pirellulales bacterium]
ILGLLVAITIPAAQQARERARAAQCQNNLRQIGIALHAYHATHELFPPGCVGITGDPINIQGWGWATFVLPYVDQENLYAAIGPSQNSMQSVLASADLQPLLRTPLAVFRCASDIGDDLQTSDRTLSGFVLGTQDQLAAVSARRTPMTILAQGRLLACIIILPASPDGGGSGHDPAPTTGNGDPTPVPTVDPTIYGVRAATSNYVASFGDLWRTDSAQWAPQDFAGNGAFGSNVSTRFSDITDGASHTFAIGERSSQSYAAIWAGTDGWDRCEREGITNVMGTAFYPINSDPEPYFLSCDSKGAGGFGSMHVGGAYFLMLDGSVRFVNNNIDFANSSDPTQLGLFQRLARRNDGEPAGGP